MKYLVYILFAILLLSACRSKPPLDVSLKKFLSSKPGQPGFEKSLKHLAENIYWEKWQIKVNFDQPKFRLEKLLVEWEDKISGKIKRKNSAYRYKSNLERLAIANLFSHTGPISPKKLFSHENYEPYIAQFSIFMLEDVKENGLNDLIESRNKIYSDLGLKVNELADNEKRYGVGLLYATGFYLGLPFYKRITLDLNINSRFEILRVYLHECGHQLFDKYRKISKSLKLGLSWIGWRKSSGDWWSIEEKSCNLFADILLNEEGEFFEKNIKVNKEKLLEKISENDFFYHKLNKKMIEKYAKLFFDSKAVEDRFNNSKVRSRYAIDDEVGLELRRFLSERGLTLFIREVNQFMTKDEVMKYISSRKDNNK